MTATAPGGATTRWRTSRWRWSGSAADGVVEHVDVEVDRGREHAQAGDAGLLLRLPQRHPGQVAVAVGVAARLEPAPHLGVEEQQHLAGARVDHRRRPGEVALEARAVEGVRVGVDEGEDLRRGSPRGCASPGRAADDGGSGRGEVVRTDQLVGRVQAHAGFDRWSEPGSHQRHGSSVPDGQADAGADGGHVGRRRAVVDDGDAPVGRHQVGAVVVAVDAEGLAEPGRPGEQVALAAWPWRAGATSRRCPATGSAARRSTATPSPSRPHTALAHQCMP